jgi:hypothetical protein
MERVCFSAQVCIRKGRNGEKKQMRYVGHTTPAGAKVVPANDDGIREINGWKFYYLGWQPNNFDATTFVRGTATRDNLKPANRKGCLDADHLRAHGLTAKRMKSTPFFFLQLLLPIATQNVLRLMVMVGCCSFPLPQHIQMDTQSWRRAGAEGMATISSS